MSPRPSFYLQDNSLIITAVQRGKDNVTSKAVEKKDKQKKKNSQSEAPSRCLAAELERLLYVFRVKILVNVEKRLNLAHNVF